jgi:hypothetical protein
VAIEGGGSAYRFVHDLLTTGVIVLGLSEVVVVNVLVDPLGIDPAEFVVLVVFVEVLADVGFVREGVLAVRAVGHRTKYSYGPVKNSGATGCS